MKTLLLSHYLEEATPAYGGERNSILFEKSRAISRGDTSNNLKLSLPNHIGTHIDFPYHFDDAGKKLDEYPPGFWIFNNIGFLHCTIEDIFQHIDSLDSNIEMLILKTGFGAYRNEDRYWATQPVLPASLAKFLKNKFQHLRVLGFDMISLTSQLDKAEGKKAHREFLIENDILILEDMNLQDLHGTPQRLIIAPLLIKGADGAPCTVLAQIDK